MVINLRLSNFFRICIFKMLHLDFITKIVTIIRVKKVQEEREEMTAPLIKLPTHELR